MAESPPLASLLRLGSYLLPNRPAMQAATGLPLGLLLSPLLPVRDVPQLRRAPLRCPDCDAPISRYCRPDLETARWTCVLCGHSDTARSHFQDLDITTYPELSHKLVEYIDPYDQPKTGGGILGRVGADDDAHVVLLIDGTLSAAELENLQTSLLTALATVSQSTRISCIVYSNVVCVYDFSESEVIAAQVIPGTQAASLDPMYAALLKTHITRFATPLGYCQQHLANVLKALSTSHSPGPLHPNLAVPVAFGAALQCALALISSLFPTAESRSSSCVNAFLFAFMGHSPSVGPGALSTESSSSNVVNDLQNAEAVEFYRNMGTAAANLRTVVSVSCIGYARFGIHALSGLTAETGGAILTYKSCGVELERDMSYILSGSNVVGSDGELVIRTSSPLELAHVIGPLSDPVSDGDATTFTIQNFNVDNCYTAYFNVSEDAVNDALYVQFEITFVNLQRERIKRILTVAWTCTGNDATFLSSVDEGVVALLIGRQKVLLSQSPSVGERAQHELDGQVVRIIRSCGKVDRRGFKLASSLAQLPHRLYHLRRGPLLGVMLQHPDDIHALKTIFLHAKYPSAIRLMEPSLFLVRQRLIPRGAEDNSGGDSKTADGAGAYDSFLSLEPVPLADIAMRSDRILLLDTETAIFIWSGQGTRTQEGEHLRSLAWKEANLVADSRYPRPYIMSFFEGESMARFFHCYMTPVHKDPLQEQIQQVPEWSSLSPTEREVVLKKFWRTDEPSFMDWCRTLSGIAISGNTNHPR